jgi:hypothetical protein
VFARLVTVFVVIIFFLVAASRRFLLLLLGLAAATSAATAFLAGLTSTILGPLLITLLVLSLLPLDKLLDLPAVLEVMALGTVNLAVLLGGALRFVGSRQGLA